MSWVAFEIDLANETEVEIASAYLQVIGFGYFEEKPTTLVAYWEGEHDLPNKEEIRLALDHLEAQDIRQESMEDRNWNEEWERNYPPVEIDKFCRIRAPFHEVDPSFEYEIEVRPAMAFGTGHHSTTSLVMRLMEDINWRDQFVLDMGCGTGVLGILAEKLGARQVVLADNFSWACESTQENLGRNNCERGEVVVGGPEALSPDQKGFNFIIANINRNVLLEHLAMYDQLALPQGEIILSGFFEEDSELINREAEKYGWVPQRSMKEKNWLAQHYTRS